jgi:2-oxoglutarate dehydrogenase complex dehydrogenase (E1) component-like enzyme
MYKIIDEQPSISDIYAEQLKKEGIIDADYSEQIRKEFVGELDDALGRVDTGQTKPV